MSRKPAKKDIPASTVVKGLITGFVSYGVLIVFIALACGIGLNYLIARLPNPNTKVLMFSIPILWMVISYFLCHIICNLSTSDLFSKCRTDKKNYKEIFDKMTVFFVVLAMVMYLLLNILLLTRVVNSRASVDIAREEYSQVFSKGFTDELTQKMLTDYTLKKDQMVLSSMLLQVGIVAGLVSLVPLQKKLIEQNNQVPKEKKAKEEPKEESSKKQSTKE